MYISKRDYSKDSKECITAYNHKLSNFIVSLTSIAEGILKDIFPENNNNTFADLIGMINKKELEEKLHVVRKKANEFKHENTFKFVFNINDNWKKYFSPINDLIEYAINRGINPKFKFKKEDLCFASNTTLDMDDIKKVPIRFITKSDNSFNPFTKYTIDTFFKKELEDNYDDFEDEIIHVSGGYFPSDNQLVFKNNVKKLENNENVAFKFIFNLLCKNNVTIMSKYLIDLNLDFEDYEKIYSYQVILSFYYGHYYNNTGNIRCDKIDLMNYAIRDLQDYYNHYCKISDVYYTFPEFTILNDNGFYINSFNFDYSREIIESKSSFLISSSKINLYINDRNIDSWNFLTNKLFNYNELKRGQIFAIDKILSQQNELNSKCCILPTGYGKSLIYQLLSFLTLKISIVIEPTKILMVDQLYNLRDFCNNYMAGILSNDIKIKNGFSSALLYYADAEALFDELIQKVIGKLKFSNKLGFVFIDECHQISIWSQNFDYNYLVLSNYLTSILANNQIILFTATANYRVKDDLIHQFKKIDFIAPNLYKREKIKHKVVFTDDDDLNYEITKLLDNYYLSESDFIMIINDNVKIISNLYKYLIENEKYKYEVVFYDDDKINAYEIFRRKVKHILIASDEFSIGINIPHITTLITIGTPYSKDWYYQESGRVSRNNVLGNSIVILSKDKSKIDIENDTNSVINYSGIRFSNLKNSLMFFSRKDEDIEIIIEILNHNIDMRCRFVVGTPYMAKFINNAIYLCMVSGVISEYKCEFSESGSIAFEVKLGISSIAYPSLESNILDFAKKYSVGNDKFKYLKSQLDSQNSVQQSISCFVNWYYDNMLYQISRQFYSIEDLLINSRNNGSNTIEKQLELFFNAKYFIFDNDSPSSNTTTNKIAEYLENENNSDIINYAFEFFKLESLKNIDINLIFSIVEDHSIVNSYKGILLILAIIEFYKSSGNMYINTLKEKLNDVEIKLFIEKAFEYSNVINIVNSEGFTYMVFEYYNIEEIVEKNYFDLEKNEIANNLMTILTIYERLGMN